MRPIRPVARLRRSCANGFARGIGSRHPAKLLGFPGKSTGPGKTNAPGCRFSSTSHPRATLLVYATSRTPLDTRAGIVLDGTGTLITATVFPSSQRSVETKPVARSSALSSRAAQTLQGSANEKPRRSGVFLGGLCDYWSRTTTTPLGGGSTA